MVITKVRLKSAGRKSKDIEGNMFTKNDKSGYRTALEGVRFKTLAVGERTHLTEFRLSGGSIVPQHSHPHEQTGYLVSGKMRFDIGGEIFEALPG
jgi:quercetin dioxygenase-like cupin family protein